MQKIKAIALNTFRESVRDRILHTLILFVLFLVVAAIVMGQIAVGQERKIIIDLGLSAMTIFGLLIAIFIGVGLVSREIKKRTIDNILSKPVRPYEFIIGKYLGLTLTLIASCLVMTASILTALIYVEGGFKSSPASLLSAAYLIYLELTVITAVALLFSCFSTPFLSAFLTIIIFLIGRWHPDLRVLAESSDSSSLRVIGKLLYNLLPNLASFNFIDEAAHGRSIMMVQVGWATVYAILYAIALVAASTLVFERRNFR